MTLDQIATDLHELAGDLFRFGYEHLDCLAVLDRARLDHLADTVRSLATQLDAHARTHPAN